MKPSPFLMWYSDARGVTLAAKIADAAAAYAARFGVEPNVALVSVDETEAPAVALSVRAVQTVRRNTVWVGVEP